MRSFIFNFVSLSLLTASSAFAQNGASDSLLARYVAESWESHPNIDNMRAMQEVAISKTSMSRTWMNPDFRVGLMNVPDNFDVNRDPMTMLQFGLMQQIPFPGKLKSAGAAEEARARAAASAIEQEKYLMANMVAMAYYDLGAAIEIRRTLEQGLELADQSVEAATSLLSAGMGTQSEVLRATLERDEWKLKLLENDSEIEQKRAALAYSLGRENGESLVDPILPDSLPPELNPGAIRVATDNQTIPQINKARELTRAAESDLRRAKLEYWPDVRLMLAYGLRGTRNSSGVDAHTGELITQSQKQDNMVTIELSAPIPLFARGNQQAKIHESRAMLLSKQRELTESALSIERDLRMIQAGWRERVMKYEVSGRLIAQAEAAWNSSLIDYQAGKFPFMSLSEGRMKLVMAQVEHVMLRAEAWTHYRAWQNTLGEYSVGTEKQ